MITPSDDQDQDRGAGSPRLVSSTRRPGHQHQGESHVEHPGAGQQLGATGEGVGEERASSSALRGLSRASTRAEERGQVPAVEHVSGSGPAQHSIDGPLERRDRLRPRRSADRPRRVRELIPVTPIRPIRSLASSASTAAAMAGSSSSRWNRGTSSPRRAAVALKGGVEPDPGPRPHPSRRLPVRPGLPARQTHGYVRHGHDDAVRRPRGGHRQGHRRLLPVASPPGVPHVPHPGDHGLPSRAAAHRLPTTPPTNTRPSGGGSGQPAGAAALHPHLGVVVEPG